MPSKQNGRNDILAADRLHLTSRQTQYPDLNKVWDRSVQIFEKVIWKKKEISLVYLKPIFPGVSKRHSAGTEFSQVEMGRIEETQLEIYNVQKYEELM